MTTPDGNHVEGKVIGPEEISVQLPADTSGVYQVSWTTVSLLDGHTLSGSLVLGVGVPVGSEASSGISTSPRMTDLLISIARAVEDLGLLLAAGLLLLGALADREPTLGWVRSRPVIPLAIASVGGIMVVTAESIVAARGLSPGGIVSYLTTGQSGVARLIRPALELLALSVALHRSRLCAWPLAGAILSLAAAGHAAAVDPRLGGVALEVVHIGAAALWVGGILALALQRPPGGWSSEQGRALLDRFTPAALAGFAVTALAGLARGVQEVGSLHELFASSYGVTLLTKSLLVALMVPLSVLAWRRRLVVPRLESGLAIGVVAAAVLLAAYPLPPARLSEAERAAGEAAQDPGLPQVGDLTLGGRAGTTLVGLTLSPGEPGRNEAFVYVLPLDGERQVPVALSIDERRVALDPCGITCRRVALDLFGGERIEVRVGGSKTLVASFDVPQLPAPDGTQLFAQLERRMRALTSYRLNQSLSSGSETLRTKYECRAPDQMRARSSGGFQTVLIGGTEYLRRAPDAGWIVESGGPPFPVLSFVWDYVPDQIIDPRIVGTAHVDGVDTTILSFYGPLGSAAYWFRLWVDATGLVRRTEMRAQGHFMNQRYFAFDAPITIEPPGGVSG
ncbi:MAG: copper resistance protein CopC/CopD [Actinomycetota bacterium]|nr:copper resistance protein CopC/CopD [Actinomycetota bacterium]